ncbi:MULTISPECIES: hypothetical protein [unclassified Bradyrhizobium]|nr:MULTISPECIES: hypothetical protein [unclassified Bradyrhizobium]
MRFATGLMLLPCLVAGADSYLRQDARDAFAAKQRTIRVNLCAKGNRQ